MLNLGIEGIMLMGAFTGFAVAYFTGNIWLGVLAVLLVCALLGLLMSFMSVTLGADQVISGLAITLLGTGLGFFLFRMLFGVRTTLPYIEGFRTVSIPILSEIPILGPALFQQYALVYIVLLIVPISAIVLFRTTLGLKITAVGENPRAADTAGINVYRIRYLCVIIGAILAGLGGAFLSLVQFHTFLSGMTAGRGFIAIALVIFSRWNPYLALGGALLFGGVDALQMRLQASGLFPLPSQFALMFPYLLTLIILIVVGRKVKGPASLCTPYKR